MMLRYIAREQDSLSSPSQFKRLGMARSCSKQKIGPQNKIFSVATHVALVPNPFSYTGNTAHSLRLFLASKWYLGHLYGVSAFPEANFKRSEWPRMWEICHFTWSIAWLSKTFETGDTTLYFDLLHHFQKSTWYSLIREILSVFLD
jgi:hypothetical protein